ncbi:hypothetical protein M6B38_253700 [Iris pallida]|uniref:Uncharacterized protein n=1 Tax=Iris pallida TaxID=29817 RepID=A0AAX6IH92_IRIPA|nr:hypothetical protein M6B38_253700 [Iris pallida]
MTPILRKANIQGDQIQSSLVSLYQLLPKLKTCKGREGNPQLCTQVQRE